MKKIERLWETEKLVTVNTPDLDELEQQLELLKGKNKALQNVVDNYHTNSSISMINDLREKLSIVARQRDEAVEALIEQLEKEKEELITAYKELLLYDAMYLYGYAPYDKRVEEYFAGEIELLEKLTGKTLVELKEERG